MFRRLLFSTTISLGAAAQATNVETYQWLQKAVSLPLVAQASPPNHGYEARLYIQHDDPVYIIEIISESGANHFFSINSGTSEAKTINGVSLKFSNQALNYKKGYYLFVCSYAFHVVD